MSQVTVPDPLPWGYVVGPYVVEKELPATTIGRVYRAHDSRLKGVVAIVVLRVDMRNQIGRRCLECGARKASLAHQPVYDVAEWLGVPYVAVGYKEDVGALVDLSAWVPSAT